jgi:hypothetical protein
VFHSKTIRRHLHTEQVGRVVSIFSTNLSAIFCVATSQMNLFDKEEEEDDGDDNDDEKGEKAKQKLRLLKRIFQLFSLFFVMMFPLFQLMKSLTLWQRKSCCATSSLCSPRKQ